jgi:Arc/MetJ-type ribon-helix-helix transcriptional regulator
MTIHLPEDLERDIRAEVLSGHFASADDLIGEAVRSFLRDHKATKTDAGLGSIGAMRDAADELDEIVAEAMKNRREDAWRELPGE